MLKRGRDLPTSDNILRYIPINRTFRDDDGVVVGVTEAAFELRLIQGKQEDGLSVLWIEYFGNDFNQAIRKSFDHFCGYRKVAKNDLFVNFEVNEFSAICSDFGFKVRIGFFPTKILNHSEIRNFPVSNKLLQKKIADIAFQRLLFIDLIISASS